VAWHCRHERPIFFDLLQSNEGRLGEEYYQYSFLWVEQSPRGIHADPTQQQALLLDCWSSVMRSLEDLRLLAAIFDCVG
jgi:hypothetical protein